VFRFPFDFSSWILASLSDGSSRLVSFPTVRLLLLARLLLPPLPGWFRSDFLVGRGRLCWLRVDLRCVPIQPKDLSCCVSRLSCRSVVSSVVHSLPFASLSGPPRVASFPPTWDGSACRRGSGTKQRLDEEETRGAWRGTDEFGSRSEASERSMGVWQSRGIGITRSPPLPTPTTRMETRGRGGDPGGGGPHPPEEFLLCPREGW